jgi:hypothetical protein
MSAYHDGRLAHEYVSDQAMLVDWFIDDDGATKFRIGEVEYPADAPTPTGPSGAEPAALAPFGVAEVDLGRLGACLRGEFAGQERVSAEQQHRMILEALNLDPRGLTIAFRHAGRAGVDLPGAQRVSDTG